MTVAVLPFNTTSLCMVVVIMDVTHLSEDKQHAEKMLHKLLKAHTSLIF